MIWRRGGRGWRSCGRGEGGKEEEEEEQQQQLSRVDLPEAPEPVTGLLRARFLFDLEEGWEGMEELRKRLGREED